MTTYDAVRVVLSMAIVGAIMILARRGGSRLAVLIQDFADALGRGPRPPSHPLPADDATLIRRRKS